MNKKENVLVAGANGTTGRQVVDLLNESANYKPIAMIRKEDQKERFEKRGVATVMGDLEDDVSHTVKDTHKVIFAAGSNGKNVIGVDQEGAKRMIDAAQKAGVDKFVMLSSMGASEPSENEDMQEYMQAKKNADEHLRKSNLKYSIVRPGALTDNDGNGNIKLADKTGRGEIPRADVARTLVGSLGHNVRENQTFQIISGEVPIEKALLS